MSLNKYMHKRNPFKNKKIDFKYFSEKYSFFKDVFTNAEISDGATIDFKSPSHIAAISKALLMDTMSLDVNIPLDRLIPTVPLRMNYILWLEDLILNSPMNKNEQINIFDIGCGASCIYPLLGASKNKWFFKASEIDEFNFSVALDNISRNGLTESIEVIKVFEQDSTFLRHAFIKGKQLSYIHCVMCNPPFFASSVDKTSILSTRNPDQRDPGKSINTGIRSESLTDGGEIQFTMNIIDESFEFQNKIGIFTVMLGKKTSCEAIKKYISSKSITNFSVFEFCQGRVMRWGIAWSFLPAFNHPKSEFQLSKDHNRPPLLWNIPVTTAGIAEYSINGLYHELKLIFNKLEIDFLEQKNRQSAGGGNHLLITANKNTWSHQRRLRREMERRARLAESQKSSDEPEPKRRRIDHICAEAAALDCSANSSSHESIGDECLVKCSFNAVIVTGADKLPELQLQARYLDGQKEAMNQILTYVKNWLQKPH